MRYIQYLNEDTDQNTKEELHDILIVIYKRCKPFINDLINQGWNKNDDLLISGRNSRDPIIYKDIRKDRRPKNTAPIRSAVYDEIFNELFHIRFRSNAIFCSGDLHQANGYGNNTYLIFPFGKYNIIWSNKVRDMYDNMYIMKIESEYDYNYGSSKELTQDIKSFIKSAYNQGEIVKALRSENEIMLHTKEYIGFDYHIYQYNIRLYISNYGKTYPTDEVFNEYYERYIKNEI